MSVVMDQMPGDRGLPCAGCSSDPADVSQPRAQNIVRTCTHLLTIGRAVASPGRQRRAAPGLELERRLRAHLDALGPAPRAELLQVLMLPALERAERIGEFFGMYLGS